MNSSTSEFIYEFIMVKVPDVVTRPGPEQPEPGPEQPEPGPEQPGPAPWGPSHRDSPGPCQVTA